MSGRSDLPSGSGGAGRDPLQDVQRNRRSREYAVLLPLLGAFLFLPPLIGLFAVPATVWGIPLIVLYIFLVWAILIGLARRMIRRLLAGSGGDQ